MARGEPVVLELQDAGGREDPPLAIRLRVVLKRLLRTYKLRCIAIHGLPPDEADTTDLDWADREPED